MGAVGRDVDMRWFWGVRREGKVEEGGFIGVGWGVGDREEEGRWGIILVLGLRFDCRLCRGHGM